MTAAAMTLELRFSIKHGLLRRRELRIKSLDRLGAFNQVDATFVGHFQHFVHICGVVSFANSACLACLPPMVCIGPLREVENAFQAASCCAVKFNLVFSAARCFARCSMRSA